MIDFLIVGGGIAGISAAARLSALGSVQLIEAENGLGYHASGRSAAMFEKSYGNQTVCALNEASEDHFLTCGPDGKGVLSPRGFMVLANESQAGDMANAMAQLKTEPITLDEAVQMCPILRKDAISSASYTEEARDLDTDRLIQDFARIARKNNAIIQTSARLKSLTFANDHWAATVEQHRKDETVIFARKIVNAAGAWADQIASLAGLAPIGLTPYRRSMARMPAPGGYDVATWPMLLDAKESWYAKPDAGAWLVSPSEEDQTEPHDAYADDMVIAEAIARYEEMVTETVVRLQTTWAGLRTFAKDRTLVLGPEKENPAFIWCAGQGGYGFQTSAAASAVIAESVGGPSSGQPSKIIQALSPNRFR